MLGILSAVDVVAKKTLFITPEQNFNVYRSIRNVPNVLGVILSDINTYDIIHSEVLVLTESAAKIFASDEAEEAA
jgi:large subunit ribosomal protein L4